MSNFEARQPVFRLRGHTKQGRGHGRNGRSRDAQPLRSAVTHTPPLKEPASRNSCKISLSLSPAPPVPAPGRAAHHRRLFPTPRREGSGRSKRNQRRFARHRKGTQCERICHGPSLPRSPIATSFLSTRREPRHARERFCTPQRPSVNNRGLTSPGCPCPAHSQFWGGGPLTLQPPPASRNDKGALEAQLTKGLAQERAERPRC